MLVHIYKGMKKNVERFSQKYYFWRRGWRGEDKLLKFAIMLLCLTCRNRYLIEIIPVSVLAEVLQAKIKNTNTSPSRQQFFSPEMSSVSHFSLFQRGEHSFFPLYHFTLWVGEWDAGNTCFGITNHCSPHKDLNSELGAVTGQDFGLSHLGNQRIFSMYGKHGAKGYLESKILT